jgi:lysophospholipase
MSCRSTGAGRAGRPGRSGPAGVVMWISFSSYLEDLEMVVQDAMLPDCPPPYFMFGNSMGAHVGLLLAIARHNWFDAAVMISPFIDVAPSRLPHWFKLLVTGSMTVLGMGRLRVPLYRDGEPDEESFAGNPLTSDRVRYNRNIRLWQAARHLSAHIPSAGWAFAALRSCTRLQKLDDNTPLKCPALLVVAGQDTVVSNEAIQQFARHVPGAAPVVINGARHDILSEQDIYRDQLFAAADAFLADRLRIAPTG